ncbi:hypothetical protein, partial [uncultured Amnibacterium sp.]|uniref:hypothetical protein n=1 Tax=uncultured Amnibacterium sp. TaxID=1631851 RepID=UPI0035CA1271
DLVAWFQSPGGARVLQTAIIPALVILVAALVSALIARSAVRAMIRRSDRIQAASAVGALVAAARVVVAPNDDDASRLRTEADVRTRLLPLTGAGLAADWAAARIDALQQRPADHSAASELDELRDRLVAWVERPARAKRLFGPSAATRVPMAGAPAPEAVEPAIDESASVGAAGQERFSRPQPGPRRTPPPEESAAAAAAPEVAAVGATARPPAPAPAAAALAASGAVPAWQRTRAGERLQQERLKTRAVEPPTVDESEPVPVSTAPVQLSHPHRAASTPSADGAEAVRLEAHQQARHARPDEPQQAADGVAPAAPVTPSPGWLDSYDDEAQVTQNLDLTTPPPVAASAVRGRGSPGEDLVPRT